MATKINRKARTDIQPYQKKVILEWMGCPAGEVPNQLKLVDLMLDQAKLENPELYWQAYEIVVGKKLPEGATSDQRDLLKLAELLDEKIGEYEGKAIDRITEKYIDGIDAYQRESKKSMTEIVDYAKETAHRMISEAAEKYIRVEHVVKTGSATVKLDGEVHERYQDIIDLASERVNVMLVGPAGCGKTHIAEQVAKGLQLDFASQSCSAGMSESIFSGWLLPIESGGQFVYVSSEFVRLYENGGVFLFDEIDASDSNTLLFLNQALANKSFYLPQRFQKPKVERHKDFVAIAAANTYGTGATVQYNGRNALDAATMDRFRAGIISMDYSRSLEEKLIDGSVLEWGWFTRDKIKQKSLRKIMSTRFLLDANKMVKNQGWTLDRIKESYFSDWSAEEKRMIQ